MVSMSETCWIVKSGQSHADEMVENVSKPASKQSASSLLLHLSSDHMLTERTYMIKTGSPWSLSMLKPCQLMLQLIKKFRLQPTSNDVRRLCQVAYMWER